MAQQTFANAGKRVIVLGGGLSGLSFAHYLRNFLAYYKKTNLVRKITLLEANDYMGGSVQSVVFDDNTVHELGPRSVRTHGAKAQNTCVLVEQLGLSDRVLTLAPKSASGKDRYVYRDGKMWPVPSNAFQLFKKLPASDKRLFHVVRKDIMNRVRMDLTQFPHRDPPLYDFIKFRFGEEATEAVLDPLLRGITAGDCRKWSTRGIFGDVLEREQSYGGIIRGITKPPVTMLEHDELFANDCLHSSLLEKLRRNNAVSFNLKTGLQTLPEHLSNSLLNANDDDVVAIYNRTQATSVQFTDELEQDGPPCSVWVKTIDGDHVKIDGDHLVAALPANNLSTILASEHSTMSQEQLKSLDYLSTIEHAPVGCVSIEFRGNKQKMPDMVKSFGFLTHSKAGSRLLGISFDSAIFPDMDHGTNAFRMTCMMGGAWYEQVFGTTDMNKVSDTQMEQIALEEVRKILNIQDEPYRMSTILWKTGIAQYKPGHVDMIKETRDNIKQARLPLTLLGQSYDGIAVNDVIYSARMAAYEFAKSL